MRVVACAVMAVSIAAVLGQPARAMQRDDTRVPGVTLVTLEEGDAPVEIQGHITQWLDAGMRIALTGPSAIVAEAGPDDVYAWPSTNTIVLDPGAGLGVFGFEASDDAHRLAVLRAWKWAHEGADASAPVRPQARAAEELSPRIRNVAFDLSGTSPASVCQSFRRKMAAQILSSAASPASAALAEKRAFRHEMRRWCQYGNLSLHQSSSPDAAIPPYQFTNEPLLTIATEWSLMRSEDPVDPEKASYFFWAKTMGRGAGNGFTRRSGSEAYYDHVYGGIFRLMDVAIHSGWGPLAHDELLTAWPLNSSFPDTGNTHVFDCDKPDEPRLFGCPRALRLHTLYPADSVDGTVTVSLAERFIVGGSAQAGVSVDNTGKVTPSFVFNLNLAQTRTDTAQTQMQLLQTHSNADTVHYRTTRWTPDVPAIYRWIASRGHRGNLSQATPLAATLNPNYEIVWELPVEENAGLRFSYNILYEVGWNTCFDGPNCATHVQPPDQSLSPKARVLWKDFMSFRMPLI
ncbi:hypothetical protein FHW69_000332 [Luteibacter sp. Sphag1AF]|uniref:hypothetical protein n=1 Tax=Luteibacter sp. Sphag1AF TaxID=2587031 RepID=UPI0016096A8C|nr:hypothetical protein [Luteibacter sp. Sphag1AF]MBB3225742.1 hypothetical protein [Luteibacter sp. Sphag1AF]